MNGNVITEFYNNEMYNGTILLDLPTDLNKPVLTEITSQITLQRRSIADVNYKMIATQIENVQQTMDIKKKFERKGKYLAYKQSMILDDKGNAKEILPGDVIIKREKKVNNYVPLTKTDYMPKEQSIIEQTIMRNNIKQHNRQGYKQRSNGPRAFRNPNQYLTLTTRQRLDFYNKTHKCSCHKLRFNKVIRSTVDGKPWYDFYCDRGIFPETNPRTMKVTCGNCFQGVVKSYDRDCDCKTYRCEYCKYQEYLPNGIADKAMPYCTCGKTRKIILEEKILERRNEVARKEFEDFLTNRGKNTHKTWSSLVESTKQEDILPDPKNIKDVPESVDYIAPTPRNLYNIFRVKQEEHKKKQQYNEELQRTLEEPGFKDYDCSICQENKTIHSYHELHGNMMGTLDNGAAKVFSVAEDSLKFVKNALVNVKDSIADLLDSLVTKIKNVLNSIKDFVKNKVIAALPSPVQMVLDYLGSWFNALTSFIKRLILRVREPTGMVLMLHLNKIWNGSFSYVDIAALIPIIYVDTREKEEVTQEGYTASMLAASFGPLLAFIYALYRHNNERDIEKVAESIYGIHANDRKSMGEWFVSIFDKITGYKTKGSEHMFKFIQKFNTLCSGWRNLSCVVIGVIGLLPNFLKRYFQAVDPKTIVRDLLKDETSHLSNMGYIACHIQSCKAAALPIPPETRDKYHEEKFKFFEKLNKDKMPLTEELMRFITRLDQMATSPVAVKIPEPFVIRVIGDAGSGKSTLATTLLSALNNETLEDTEAKTFYRNPNTEYWDGYTEQHRYVVYDDFNQDREERDLKEMIVLASGGTLLGNYSNNDPSLQSSHGTKGDALNVEAVLCCSNSKKIFANTLNSNDAINRRKHVTYEFKFKEELGLNQQGKARKVNSDFSHLKIYKLDANYDVVKCWEEGGEESIQEVRKDIRREYLKFTQQQKSLKFNLKQLCKPIVDEELDEDINEQGGIKLHGDDDEDRTSWKAYVNGWKQQVQANTVPLRRTWYEQIKEKFKLGYNVFRSYITGVATKVNNAFGWLTEFAKTWVTPLSIFATAIGGALFVAKAFKDMQEIHSGENKNQKMKVTLKVKDTHAMMEPEFLIKNLAMLKAHKRTTNIIFVKGNIALCPKHLFYDYDKEITSEKIQYWDDGVELVLQAPGMAPMTDVFKQKNLVEILPDIVLYKFSPNIASRSTITQHFWEGEEILNARKAMTYQVKAGGKVMTHWGQVINDHIESVLTLDGYTATHESILTNLPSVQGDCGAPIIIPQLAGPKIVSINSGLMATGSFSNIITRSQIEKALEKINTIERAIIHGLMEPTLKDLEENPFSNTALMLVGINPKKVLPPIKSKITPSPIHDMVVEHKTEPCIIDMRDPRLNGVNTYKENMLKYGTPARKLPDTYLRAADFVIELMNKQLTTRLNRPLTIDEAINGVPNMPYLTAMEMTTSPGFPWVLEGVNGEKRKLFNGTPGNYEPIPELMRQILEILERCKQGIFPDYPFITTVKDERKDIEDVLKGKSRMFTIPGVAYSIVMRMMLLPTLAHLYQCRHNTFITIGMDKCSHEWDAMVRYLLEVGNVFEDMDYKKFDTTAEIHVRLALSPLFMLPLMTEEDKKITQVLLHYDAQALVQWDKYVLALPMGTCSGSILTAPIGSLINQVYLLTSWIELAPIELKDPRYFMKYVRNKNYGDDLAMTTSGVVSDWFNAPNIAAFLKKYGITLTPGDKSDTFKKCSVFEFVYLKNKTGIRDGRYVPLQEKPEEPLNWIRQDSTSEPADKCCEDNCNAVLRALFFYGPQRFNTIRRAILKLKPYNLLTYEALADEWYQVGRLTDFEGTFTFGQSTLPNKEKIERIPREAEEYVRSEKMMIQVNLRDTHSFTEEEEALIAEQAYGCLAISNSHNHSFLKRIYDEDGGSFIMAEGRLACKLADAYNKGMLTSYNGNKRWPCLWGVKLSDIFANPPPVHKYQCMCQISLVNKTRHPIPIHTAKKTEHGTVIETTSYLLSGDDEYLKALDIVHSTLEIPATMRIRSFVQQLHSGEGATGTLDEPAAITDNRQGVAMTEQKTPATLSRVENKTVAMNTRAEKFNPDQAFDLKMMLNRWNYIDTVVWKATDAVGAIIYNKDVLQDMLTSEIAATPFNRFNLARFDNMLIRMETIGYRFARGRLLAYFAPTQRPKSEINSTEAFSIKQAVLLGAVSLDPAGATIAQLKIDFTYFKQYVDLVNDDVLGQLVMIVQNQFVPGTAGSNECGIKLFFSLTDAEFKQPRPGAITSFRDLHAIDDIIDSGANELKKLAHDILPDKLISDVLGGILDAPQIGEQPMPIINKQLQYMNNAKNLQYVDVLALDPSAQQLVDKDVFSTSVNEMMIKELIRKANFVTTAMWKRTDEVGTLLYSANVGPMFEIPNVIPNTIDITTVSYVGSMFRYWRGSMVYFVEIVSTQMHEGKIDFCFHPQLSAVKAGALTYPAKLSQYMNTLHLRNGGNMFAIRVPYPGDSPVKIVYNGISLDDTPATGNYRFQDYFSGSITLSVSSLLNAPESVQPDVEVNIYCMAGEDFEYFMPTLNNSSLQPVAAAPEEAVFIARKMQVLELHSAEDSLDRNTPFREMPTITLGVGSCVAGDIKQSQFGEHYNSLRDMCKRYTRSGAFSYDIPDVTTLSTEIKSGAKPITFVVPANVVSGYSNLGVSPIERIARMYRNFRGAMVVKVKVHTLRYELSTHNLTEIPATTLITQFQGQADNSTSLIWDNILNFQPNAIATEKQVAEFKAPFLHNRTSSLVLQNFDVVSNAYQENDFENTKFLLQTFLRIPPAMNGSITLFYEAWMALADEATFGVFYQVPKVQLAPTSSPQTPLLPDYWVVEQPGKATRPIKNEITLNGAANRQQRK